MEASKYFFHKPMISKLCKKLCCFSLEYLEDGTLHNRIFTLGCTKMRIEDVQQSLSDISQYFPQSKICNIILWRYNYEK